MPGYQNQSYRPFNSGKQPKKGLSLFEKAQAKQAEAEKAATTEPKRDEEATRPNDEP